MADADTPKAETDLDVMDAVLATEPTAAPEPRPSEMATAPVREPSPPAPRRPSPARSGGFVPAVLGGALAVAAGFGLSHYNLLGTATPVDTSATDQSIAALSAELTATKDAVAKLAARPGPDATLAARLGAVEATLQALPPPPDLAGLDQRMTGLESQMTAIAAMPADGSAASPAALAAIMAEIDQLKGAGATLTADVEAAAAAAEARLAAAEAQAATLKAEAEAISSTAKANAALGRIQAALETGAPFATALADLPQADIPAALTDTAATGLPTLRAVQDGFPDAARAALEAALRANMGESWAERVGSFLRSQTGARSLTPRDGTDPDAVLSRAEAALAAGDIPTALTEIAALPPEGQAAMADWVALAQRRVAATDAVAALTAAIGQ